MNRCPRPLWLAAFASLLLLLGLLGYSGSSGLISVRQCPLETTQTRARYVELFSQSRPIRSDEFAVESPIARAQQLAHPSFPEVNLDVGLGMPARNPYGIPILDWGATFRPHLWSLFTGSPWGFGPRWFLRSCLILVGVWAWMRVVTARRDASEEHRRARTLITSLGALAVFFSTAISWWQSTSIPETIAYSGLGVAAGQRFLLAHRPAVKAGWLIAAWYLLTCAFFGFYPPIWGPVLWLVCATFIDSRWRQPLNGWRTVAGVPLFLGVVAVAVLTAVAYYAPYLATVMHTVYPGQRRTVAGTLPLARLFTMAWPSVGIVSPLGGGERELAPTEDPSNVCEFSGIEVIPLIVLLVVASADGPIRRATARALRANPMLVVALLVLAAWQFIPLPGAVGTLLLLRFTTGVRTWFIFGLGSALLAVAILTEIRAPAPTWDRGTWRGTLLAALACFALFLPVYQHYHAAAAGSAQALRYWGPMALAAALLLLGVATLNRRGGALLIALGWTIPLVLVNGGVNPLVRSRDLFPADSGHQAMAALLNARPGRIVDYGTHFGAQLTGHGFASLGSVHVAPDLDLFGFLAPEAPGLTQEVYNRYAHVRFAFPPNGSAVLGGDSIQVAISPCSARLATLWVNYFLTGQSTNLPAECAAAFDSRDIGQSRLWSRKRAVGPVGMATKDTPNTALDFDFAAPSEVRLTRKRQGLLIEAPRGGRTFATAVNLSMIDAITCRGASAHTLDAHVVVTPDGREPVRCEVEYLGTLGGLARLVGRRRSLGVSP